MAEKGKANKKKKEGMSMKARLFMIVLVFLGVIFLPTSLILMVGMLPSLAAMVGERAGRGTRASTVAAMNSAGCLPFVFKLWSQGNDFEASIDIITNSQTLAIIYLAAAFGYMIDFVVKHIVASFLYHKGLRRMKDIKARQAVLIEHWGREVAGVAMSAESEEDLAEGAPEKA